MTKVLLLLGLLLLLSPPVYAGMIYPFTSTVYPDSVVLNATIEDTGGSPECGWIVILRNGADTFYIERQIGSTINVRFADTNIEPNTLYCYTMDFRAFPAPVPCTQYAFCQAFDCFYDIRTCVNTGPDPVFLAHGLLSEFYPGGYEIDHNETQALLYDCNDADQIVIDLHALPLDAEPYLDSGQGVDVYGTWWCCWAQGIWLLVAEVVVPRDCVLATEETTWGRVKALYRE
jgi:hypothetical protein